MTDLAALAEALKPWKCCGAPNLCGATCQDDELSATLAKAYELVRQAADDVPTVAELTGIAKDIWPKGGNGLSREAVVGSPNA